MYYAMYIKLYIVIVVYNIIVNKNIRLAVKKNKLFHISHNLYVIHGFAVTTQTKF